MDAHPLTHRYHVHTLQGHAAHNPQQLGGEDSGNITKENVRLDGVLTHHDSGNPITDILTMGTIDNHTLTDKAHPSRSLRNRNEDPNELNIFNNTAVHHPRRQISGEAKIDVEGMTTVRPVLTPNTALDQYQVPRLAPSDAEWTKGASIRAVAARNEMTKPDAYMAREPYTSTAIRESSFHDQRQT